MRYSQKGFGVIEGLIILLILAVAGFVGWRVYESVENTKKATNDSNMSKVLQSASYKRIVAVGDIVCDPQDSHIASHDQNYCQDYETAQQVKQMSPDAFLVLGDLQYDDGSSEKFQNTFSKNWGSLKDIMYPAPGNHEYATPQANGYYTYFKGSPQDASKGYYGFMLGDWHIISLDSNCDKIGGCGQDTQQLKWLEEELSNNQAKCTLAFWHHPRFTSGKYMDDPTTKNRSENMWVKLVAHKADVVLNGHDHLYERFAPQTAAGEAAEEGVRQFTVGTGGKSHYDQEGTASNSEKVVDNQYGVLAMDIHPNAYNWKFRTTGGQIIDSGYQQCS